MPLPLAQGRRAPPQPTAAISALPDQDRRWIRAKIRRRVSAHDGGAVEVLLPLPAWVWVDGGGGDEVGASGVARGEAAKVRDLEPRFRVMSLAVLNEEMRCPTTTA